MSGVYRRPFRLPPRTRWIGTSGGPTKYGNFTANAVIKVPGGTTYLIDSFNRTVAANGFGTSDDGQTYTESSYGTTEYWVDTGAAHITLDDGDAQSAYIDSNALTSVIWGFLRVRIPTDPGGDFSVKVGVGGRVNNALGVGGYLEFYRSGVDVNVRPVASASVSSTSDPGSALSFGEWWNLRVYAAADSDGVCRYAAAKSWKDGDSEPGSWQDEEFSGSDTLPGKDPSLWSILSGASATIEVSDVRIYGRNVFFATADAVIKANSGTKTFGVDAVIKKTISQYAAITQGSTSNTFDIRGSSGNNEELAQSFPISSTLPIAGVTLYLRRVGTPSDNTVVKISSSLDGTSLASDSIQSSSVSDVSDTRDPKFFSLPVILSASTYYIEVERSGSRDIFHVIQVWVDGNNYYPDGKAWQRSNGSWSELELGWHDLGFILWASVAFTADAVVKKAQTGSFDASAWIAFTIDAWIVAGALTFPADAIVKKTWDTGKSLTSDAVILRNSGTKTFGVDAFILGWFRADAQIVKSFPFNAIVKKTITVTGGNGGLIPLLLASVGGTTIDAVIAGIKVFQADAIIRTTQATGTLFAAEATKKRTWDTDFFSTEAAIKKTQATGKTFAVEAIIFRTWGPANGKTFLADATFKKTQATGKTFTVDATFKKNQATGTVFNAEAALKKTQATGKNFAADAVLKRTISPTGFTADAIRKATMPPASVTVTTIQDGGPSQNEIQQITINATGGTWLLLWENSPGLPIGPFDWNVSATDFKTIFDAWYAPPPDSGLIVTKVGNVYTLEFAGDSGLHNWNQHGADGSNLVGGATVYADAVIFASSGTKTFTADAVIKKTQAVGTTFSANAVELKTQSSSLAADAFVLGWLTVDARVGGAYLFSAAAIISKTISVTDIPVEAIKLDTISVTERTADSIKKRTQSGSLAVDAFILGWFRADARIAGHLFIDATIRKTQSDGKTFTVDAVKHETISVSNKTIDAVLFRSWEVTTTKADAAIRKTITVPTTTVDAVLLRNSGTKTLSAEAIILRREERTFAAEAIKFETIWVANKTADAVIRKTVTSLFFAAEAIIWRTQEGSFYAEAVVRSTEEWTFSVEALRSSVGRCMWTTPGNTVAISSTPELAFYMPDACDPDLAMHFEIQLDVADTFDTGSLRVIKSHLDQTGWQYWDGGTWQAIPQGGVPFAYCGNEARYTIQTPLTNGTWYRRVRAGVI